MTAKKRPKTRNVVAKYAHQFNKMKVQKSKKDKAKHSKPKHKINHED